MNNNLEIPLETRYDKAHAVIKGLIGSAPLLGSSLAAEIFGMIVTAPITKRRNEWMQSVAEMIVALWEKVDNLSIERLQDDEEFITILMMASEKATRTHLQEKRRLLCNAVANSYNSKTSFDTHEIYLNFIGELTLKNIHLLKRIGVTSIDELCMLSTLEEMYETFGWDSTIGDLATFRFLIKDLDGKGLIFLSENVHELRDEVYGDVIFVPENSGNDKMPFIKITKFGEGFIEYITVDF